MNTGILGAAALAFALGAAVTAQAEEVTLRAASNFATGTTFSKPYEAFVARVNETGKGIVQIQAVGGPEAVPPFELGNALSTGVIDVANIASAFYTTLLPEIDVLKLSENTIQDQRANGCYDMLDALHAERVNAKYLGRVGDHIQFHLYLRKPLAGPDLSGLTIRTTPVYQAMFQALGATPVTTAPGEVYTALERGTIDGYGWPIQGVLDLGWHEQTKYRVDPGFYQVDVNILVNLDKWQSLGDEQRRVMEEAMAFIEAQNEANLAINESEAARQAEAGIETIALEGADSDKWLGTARDVGWGRIEAINADFASKLRPCFTR